MRTTFFIVFLVLTLSKNLDANNDLDTKHRVWAFRMSFTNYYSKRMFAIPTKGENIFNSHFTWGFDGGIGISRIINNRFFTEFLFSFKVANISNALDLNVDKIYSLQNSGSDYTQFFNENADYFEEEKFSLNLWYRLKNKPNTFIVMLGLGMKGPVKTSYYFNSYVKLEPDGSYNYFLRAKYYSNPELSFYPSMNAGIGYEYKLWKKSRVFFALIFEYTNTMYFYGNYKTTPTAAFEAEGLLFYKPYEAGFNITYMF
jgi:hypothetical protein